MSKKWHNMTKTEKLDMLRDEVDTLKRRQGDAAQSAPKQTKKAKKAMKAVKKAAPGEEPFST